jgi:hypothetical protein
MPDTENVESRPNRPTRRQLLAGAGIGSVVWAAPAVLTLQPASALAAGSPPPPDGVDRCAAAVLSGGPEGTETLGVDDDFEVYVNGTLVYSDADDEANQYPPVQLGSVVDGDLIRVVATNSCYYGGPVQISPLYLHCTATGAKQVLDPDGMPTQGGYGPCDVFYDKTFVVTY